MDIIDINGTASVSIRSTAIAVVAVIVVITSDGAVAGSVCVSAAATIGVVELATVVAIVEDTDVAAAFRDTVIAVINVVIVVITGDGAAVGSVCISALLLLSALSSLLVQ